MNQAPIGPGGWNPGPLLAAPRLGFPELFGTSLWIFRRGFWLFLLLGAIPVVLTATAGFLLASVFAVQLLTAVIARNAVGLLEGPALAFGALGLAWALLAVQCGAVIVGVADQLAGNGRPDLGAAARASATIVPRTVVVLTLAWAAAAAALTGILRLFALVPRPDIAGSPVEGREAAVAYLVQLLVWGLLVGCAAWAAYQLVRAKLFLFLPAAALERLGGFAAVRRSLRLTRGAFWPILGALLLVWFTEVGAGNVASILGTGGYSAGPEAQGGLQTMATSLLGSMAVPLVVTSVLASLTGAFLTVMSTVAYRFQAGRVTG